MNQEKYLPELLNEGLQLWLKGEEQLGFKAPAGKISPDLKERLIAGKPDLLKTMRPGRRYSPCSSGQHRLWFLEELEGPSPVYTIFLTFRLDGTFSREMLQKSLDLLSSRHASFRTTFEAIDGQPLQVIHDEMELPVIFTDLSDVEIEESSLVDTHLKKRTEHIFDLKNGPLWRCELLKLSPDVHVLMLLCHHIVSDGVSMSIVLKELDLIYNALEEGRQPEFEDAAAFSDFVCRRIEWSRGEDAEHQLKYWTAQLKDCKTPLQLPLDKDRPQLQSSKGDLLFGALDSELQAAIDRKAREEQVSVFMYLTTAVNIFLARFSRQDTILLGLPVANRESRDVSNTVGYFANTLVLKSSVDLRKSFKETLKQVRKTSLEAFKHQDTPFEEIVNALDVERDRSRTPVFQALLSYEENSAKPPTFGSVKMKRLEVAGNVARTDLSIWISKESGETRFGFEYATSLFEPESIRRMMDAFVAILKASVLDVEMPVYKLPMMTDTEQKRILIDWNKTETDYPDARLLHVLLEETAERSPDKMAVVFADSELTYSELNASANRLAHLLIGMGVGPGKRLGLYMKRSLEMLISLLAIQKTGAAYVPMDPDFPEDRLQYMLEDADISLLITGNELHSNLPQYSGQRLCYENCAAELQKQPAGNPDLDLDPAAPIYVIYTSGSTGLPKGVVLPNRAVVNFLLSMKNSPGMLESDRLLAITTLSFDIAVLELYLPLLAGATVVIAPREAVLDGEMLQEVLQKNRITIMQATPASWQILLESGWKPKGEFKALCGGEAMPRSLCDALLQRGAELWNMYGPTETCVWSCVEKMKAGQDKILIGKPISNTTIFITDDQLQPLPIGVPGNLWIGGDGLAIEYLNRPELTAERFVASPFEAGTRIYQTGDLARYLPDGRIECLGRSDFQMKLRGYRIEAGEIEARLCEYPGIDQAVVCIKEFSEGDKRLVAYVIASVSLKDKLGDIQASLRKQLPDYMLPSALMEMEEYPLTPNGKIDRKMLPLPGNSSSSGVKSANDQPTDELEKALLEIWESVLMTKSIGIHDSFFQIGGHSLLAARIFARIEQQLGKKLPLATLFSVQTIAGLAELLREEKDSGDWRSLVPIHSEGSRKPLFLIHGAGGNVLLYRDLAKYLGEDQPVYGLQAQGLDGSMNYLTRFEDMAERYIREIREVQPRGPYYLGGYCLGGTIAFEIARQLDAIGEKVALLAMFESFNIQTLDKKYHESKYEMVYKFQNWMFHFRNLMSVDGKERNRFFLEKARVERSRAKAALQVGFGRVKSKLKGEEVVEDKKVPVILDPINDKAQSYYHPKPYSGRITLFRPEKHFIGFGDAYSGWSGLAEGGIDLQHMPLCPRGMMVEPFVQLLAEKLNKCIESTVDKRKESAIKLQGMKCEEK